MNFKVIVTGVGGADFIGDGSIEEAIQKCNSVELGKQVILYIGETPVAFKNPDQDKIPEAVVIRLIKEFGNV